jgi:hypothetical protein
VASVERFSPVFGVLCPFCFIDMAGRIEPDVPAQSVSLVQDVSGHHVNDVHHQCIEVIDHGMVTGKDRPDLNFDVGEGPGVAIVGGKVRVRKLWIQS